MRLRLPLPTPQASHRESKRVVDVVQLKAEAVLSTVVNAKATTLPTLGAYNFNSTVPLATTEPPEQPKVLRRKPPGRPLVAGQTTMA